MNVLKRLIAKLLNSTINIDGKPYLTRYYVFLKDRKLCNIYIHHFHSSDQGDELHNHPWLFAVSVVLVNSYWEEFRTVTHKVKKRLIKAPTLNLITSSDFHRVDLLMRKRAHGRCFFAGPRLDTWGFWSRQTGEFRDWTTNPEAIA